VGKLRQNVKKESGQKDQQVQNMDGNIRREYVRLVGISGSKNTSLHNGIKGED